MSSSPDAVTLRLTSADFDAYLPERATSNAFTPARQELKQRMLAWAGGVVSRLAEIGIQVEVTASDEHPSLRNGRRVDNQRVFFWRDAAARAQIERLVDRKRPIGSVLDDPAPYQQHVFLALRLDALRVEVSVELHPDAAIDARNLHTLLGDPARLLALTSTIEALPDPFTLGLSGDVQRTPAAQVTSDALRALTERSESERRPLWIGWSIPRDVAVTHSELLDDQLEDAIVALGPIVKLVAWARDNDLADLGEPADGARGEGDEASERGRDSRPARRDRTDQAARERVRARDARSNAVEDAPSEAPPPVADVHEDLTRRDAPPRPLPRVLPRRPMVTEVNPALAIEKGVRVQVLAGPFRGKVGVVQELDGKGAARVMLGLLATRVEIKDLIGAAEGKDRPQLGSSHRKPMGVRS
jgi:hypothetical protein